MSSLGNSLWDTILRQCKQFRKVPLSFPDNHYTYWDTIDYIRAIIRVAANIAEVKKGTGEPIMTVKTILEDPRAANMDITPLQVENILGLKKYS
jgi:hypothetical protein